jgi:type IV secretory pathway VirB3-like protein
MVIYHNVETVSKCYGQIIETEAKLIPLTHICTHMTVYICVSERSCVYIGVSERSCVYICVSERSCVYICVLVNGHVCTYVLVENEKQTLNTTMWKQFQNLMDK